MVPSRADPGQGAGRSLAHGAPFGDTPLMKRLYICLLLALYACGGGATGRADGGRSTAMAGADTVADRPVSAVPVPDSITDDGRSLRALPASAARELTEPAAVTIRVLRVASPSGGGDAILVADSAAVPPRHLLIDAGHDGTAAAALRAWGIDTLDLAVLTHAHHDHYGGLTHVLDSVSVRAFAFNGQARTAVTYRRLLERVLQDVPTTLVVDTIRQVRLGGGPEATQIVLIPPLDRHLGVETDDGRRLNEGSIGVRVQRGAFSFLTTGDAELAANRRFAREFGPLVDVTVLKLGHHGSSNATQDFWLDAAAPEVAVISANGTTHPHTEVLELVLERGIDVYCTPQHGTVTIRVAMDGRYVVTSEASPRLRCEPGSAR